MKSAKINLKKTKQILLPKKPQHLLKDFITGLVEDSTKKILIYQKEEEESLNSIITTSKEIISTERDKHTIQIEVEGNIKTEGDSLEEIKVAINQKVHIIKLNKKKRLKGNM